MHRFILIATFLLTSHAMATTAPADKPIKRRASLEQAAPRANALALGVREDVTLFAEQLALNRNIDPEWALAALAQAQHIPAVTRFVLPSSNGAAKNWNAYRGRFIDATRINAGANFWQAQRETLERAEREFGVPAEIVVGIVGVETIYGQQMGDYRVIDTLATLAFDFPAEHPRAAERARYFRGELEQFLVTHATAGTNPLLPRGSYAGAMGMPQFMPSSIDKWAIDYDGDKHVDLAGSAADVIGSVANYFRAHGWIPGMPTHYPVSFDPSRLDLQGLLAPDILPTFSVESFQAKGAVLQGVALEHKGPLALVELQNGGDPPSYVAGTQNFYVITRYNWSSYYAMAVIELGQEVKRSLAQDKPVASLRERRAVRASAAVQAQARARSAGSTTEKRAFAQRSDP